MHELSLCQNLLEIIEQQAEQQAFSRVSAIRLEVGELATVEVEALRFAFAVSSRGTRAAHARLEIVSVAGVARCEHCQQEVSVSRYYDACPLCGRFGLHITSGDGLRIRDLEVG
jgi:hydrogenase nickel incorporation protein HypA/HybF